MDRLLAKSKKLAALNNTVTHPVSVFVNGENHLTQEAAMELRAQLDVALLKLQNDDVAAEHQRSRWKPRRRQKRLAKSRIGSVKKRTSQLAKSIKVPFQAT
jgi:plasmid maintenance system antidote protein VapI